MTPVCGQKRFDCSSIIARDTAIVTVVDDNLPSDLEAIFQECQQLFWWMPIHTRETHLCKFCACRCVSETWTGELLVTEHHLSVRNHCSIGKSWDGFEGQPCLLQGAVVAKLTVNVSSWPEDCCPSSARSHWAVPTTCVLCNIDNCPDWRKCHDSVLLVSQTSSFMKKDLVSLSKTGRLAARVVTWFARDPNALAGTRPLLKS